MLAGGKTERWLVKVGLLPDRISALLWPTALVLMLPPSPMWQHHTGAVDWGGAQSSLHGSLCAPCDTVFYITKETRNGGEKRQVMVIYDHASHRLSIRSWESYKTCNLSLGRKEVIQPSVSVLFTYRMQNTSKTLYRAKKCFFFFFQRVLRCCFLELHVSFSLQNTSARAGKAGALCRRLEPGVQYCLMKDRAGLVALGAEAIRNDARTWVAPFYLTIASDSCPDLIAVGRKKRTCSSAC